MALSEIISVSEMKRLVLTERKTHEEISFILQEMYPETRGLSSMSVRRFCNEHEIRTRTTLNDEEVEKEVSKALVQVIFYAFLKVLLAICWCVFCRKGF